MPKADMDLLVEKEFWREKLAGAVLHENKLYRRYNAFSHLLTPYERNWEILHMPSAETLELVRAYKNAELYRKAIVNESLPAFGYEIGINDMFGRALMTHYLGLIEYRKSAPEFREIMLHDTSGDMKSFAIEGIHRLGFREYVPDMIKILRNSKNENIRHNIVYAFECLKDKRALVPLREYFEENIQKIHFSESAGKTFSDYSHEWGRLIDALGAMLKIGGKLAEESLKEAYNDENIHIHNAAKRAIWDSGYANKHPEKMDWEL